MLCFLCKQVIDECNNLSPGEPIGYYLNNKPLGIFGVFFACNGGGTSFSVWSCIIVDGDSVDDDDDDNDDDDDDDDNDDNDDDDDAAAKTISNDELHNNMYTIRLR